MAKQFSRQLDPKQGMEMEEDVFVPVGFVTKLKIGGKELKADIECRKPDKRGDTLKAAMVLENVFWAMGTNDSLSFSGRVSPKNRAIVAEQLYDKLDGNAVDIDFEVWEYDYSEKKPVYFTSFQGKGLAALLESGGGYVALDCGDMPADDIAAPLNYTLNFSLDATSSKAQKLTVAVSKKTKFEKAWGMKSG